MSVGSKRLEMRARALVPRWTRWMYRVGRGVLLDQPMSPELPQELVEGCSVCATRYHLLDQLPKGGVVAELGTYRGDFAREILARVLPERLHVIDVDYSQFDRSLLADGRLERHDGLTHEVIERFPDRMFDWAYIDADHAYAGVLRDAEATAPKIKAGGLMVFNDYAHIDPKLGRYGVHRAVTDFVLEHRWRLRYLALNGAGLYDVAVQRPLA